MSGTIRLSGLSGQHKEAREALLGVIIPPQWFGEIAVFDGLARTHHAHATEPCTLLQIPHVELLAWLQAHPRHWRDLGLLMADKLRMDEGSTRRTLAITQEELALIIGATRQTTNQILKDMEAQGICGCSVGR